MNATEIDDYQSLVYVKPYCRVAPYLVGMALGCLFHYKTKSLVSSAFATVRHRVVVCTPRVFNK